MPKRTATIRSFPLTVTGFFKLPLAIIGLCGLLMLSGCASNDTESSGSQGGAPEAGQTFDANSWKSVIPKSCQRFTDGCNNCVRNLESGVAACTRKACVAYSKPECLDGTINGAASTEPKTVTYRCDSDNRLTVSYGRYVHDGKTVELQPGQIILRDLQMGSAHLLNQVRSASGERYQGDGLEFWGKGKEAMIRQGGRSLYQNCMVQ